MKALTLKTVALIFGLSSATLANANTFKLAMVEDSKWSDTIASESYTLALEELDMESTADELSYFEYKMASCVSNLMVKALEQAKLDCQSALEGTARLPISKSQKARYEAFSLSNLAVVNYMQKNYRIAYGQFTQARKIYGHQITKANLLTFNELMTESYLLAKN